MRAVLVVAIVIYAARPLGATLLSKAVHHATQAIGAKKAPGAMSGCFHVCFATK
jgi:hypothetical protein